MPDTLEVVPLDRRYINKVIAFLRRTYGPRFYGADEIYFDWLYLRSPCRWFSQRAEKGEIPVNAILDETDSVIAVHAYVPFDAYTPWNGERGIWDVDWIGNRNVRGAGRALADLLLNDVDIYVGYGYSDLSETAFKKMGMTLIPGIPRLVSILERNVLRRLIEAAGFGEKAQTLPENNCATKAPWHLLNGTTSIPRCILERYEEITPFGVSRTPEWLQWRYDEHPYIDYSILATIPDGSKGVAVVRLEKVKDEPYHVCRIMEFLDMEGHEAELYEAVLSFAGENGCLLVDYFTASVARAESFDTWSSTLSSPVLVDPAVPYMFQPVAFAENNSINLVISTGGQISATPKLDCFHATKGDSNQDISREIFTSGNLIS